MVTCLVILYTAFVVVLFKFKLLRPRPVPIAAVVLAGILLIGGIVVWWMQAAPMSSRVVATQFVVQIVPYVKGQITKVHAWPLVPLKMGELLLEIDPAPYQYAVNQATAQVRAAQENVKQSQAAVEAAKANVAKSTAAVNQAQATVNAAKAGVAEAQAAVKKAAAAMELAKIDLTILLNVQKSDAAAVSKQKIDQNQQNVKEKEAALSQAEAGVGQGQATVMQAEAGLGQAQAAVHQAEAALRQSEFGLQVATSSVGVVQAQLDEARFNLGQCQVKAPADGFVVNWQVLEGTMVGPTAAAGTFVSTAETVVAAVYPQNYLTNVRPGNEVELVLDPYPGQLFPGKVDAVIEATGEGQFAPGGTIPHAASIGSQGMLAVKIRLAGPAPSPNVPLGAGGAVAIYTDAGKPVHVISKVTIRMKKWLLYVLPT